MLSSSDIQSTDRQGVVISTVFILVRKQLTLFPEFMFSLIVIQFVFN